MLLSTLGCSLKAFLSLMQHGPVLVALGPTSKQPLSLFMYAGCWVHKERSTLELADTFVGDLHARHMFGKSKKCRNVAYFPWWAHGVTASACTAVAFRLHPFECPAPAVLTCFPNRCPVKLWLAASLRLGGGHCLI